MKIEFKDCGLGMAYQLVINNIGTNSFVYKEATGDCQSFTIGNVQDIIYDYLDWKNILAACCKLINKPCLLVNMRTDKISYERFINFFEEYIIVNNHYISTRGSNMSLLLVKTNKLMKLEIEQTI